MPVTFPSLEFFRALAALMTREEERFRKLGFFDATIGIRVLGAHPGVPDRCFALAFEVFECARVEEVADLAGRGTDFVLEGRIDAWREMFDNVREHHGADVAHTINTLTHFGERLQLRYDDPDGHDKLYRFAESVQEFF